MSEASNERLLEELAFGEDWRIDHLGRLISAVDGVQRKLDDLIAVLPDKWSGDAADLALSRLRVHRGNLGKFRGVLNEAQALVTGMSETSCAASCANTVRRAEAQRLLSALPSGVVPSWVHDAVNQGKTVEVPFFGTVDLNRGTEALANHLGAGREEAAHAALAEMTRVIDTEAAKLQALSVEYDPLPTGDGSTEPVPPLEIPRGTGPGGPGGAAGGPGGPSAWERPSSPGPGGSGDGGGSGGPGGPGGSGGSGGGHDSGADRPGDYSGVPGDPGGDGRPGGSDGSGTGSGDGPGQRPSIDSGLDGSTVRSGLGAAGLGAVGLAAGARLAGLGGAAGGAAGLGGSGAAGVAGLGSAGGGLRGAAVAAGAGGAGGSGSTGSGTGARGGARPGGMMMGAAGAGGTEKKSRKPGLGGYLAPKLEDEGDQGPAARASRAGSRGELSE
ncbi:hypothetical protein [Leucobacter triazinivorans]|uniref:Uncharacterized protein n=1 Tax=Leucobacter triazinivorans TaxID=1784719 RepID=A0A4P6KH27_9MICO|nr:hypothetical protein [Leucobacter triazinivorans]QBE49391.1 hypothetical protein EVS81_11535 [Leucobacter triazinivorans]